MNANTARITASSFLAYFAMSGMLSQAGLVTRAMADHFDRPLTDVTALFSFYGTGILIGSAIAVAILDRLRTAQVVRATTAGFAAALVLLWWTDSWIGFRWWLAAAGVLAGIGLSAAAFVITATYAPRWRASMLIATDLCFSFAGVFMSLAVAALLAAGALWSSGYLLVAAAAVLNLALALGSRFPDPPAITQHARPTLPIVVWLCGIGLLGYTFAQMTLMIWLPSHLVDALGADLSAGGAAIGSYWTGMAIGQAAVFFLVLVLPLRLTLGLLLVASLALTLALPTLTDAGTVTALVFALGIANSGQLKLIISWASLAMSDPPPRLLSVLLLCATTGTAASPALSAWIVEFGGTGAALVAAACGNGLLILMVVAAMLRQRRPAPIGVAAATTP
ncbi:MAG TPA: MFS transporter TsgA [Pseudomonadales bacterium]|nr:MFS transporter TsgA [Pseudomonadales bacterium]